jgi:hypothetical protein
MDYSKIKPGLRFNNLDHDGNPVPYVVLATVTARPGESIIARVKRDGTHGQPMAMANASILFCLPVGG